jgi:superfamily II DNA or RNA helicase
LFPLQVESSRVSEVLELHPKAPGPVVHCDYKDLKKYKFKNVHVLCNCTQEQKLREIDSLISWFKSKAMTGNQAMKQTWLYFCGKRLEFLADCKLQWVKLILHHLDKERTITFCKTISQTEQLGKNCIHSQNKDATKVYDAFNNKKIHHITAVNILNENANLVDCKYAIFANLSSSEVVIPQRIGRSMRHKQPVIIFPYYKGTREEEILQKMLDGFNKDFIKVIHSIKEI